VWDPVEMKIFIPNELCKRLKTLAGDTSRDSASEYAEKNVSLSKYAIILASG
jgi:predicted DNA-binding protein